MKSFWQSHTPITILLLPISLAYQTLSLIIKIFSQPKKVKAFVICIGSRFVGGAGKTPVAIAVAKLQKRKVAFVSRGYGGSLSSRRTPIKVKLKTHQASEVGDEPLLLASHHPTYICINRYKAAEMAVQDGAEIIIMDDGLQNYSLYQDYKIALEDINAVGNGLIFPAGPLRALTIEANLYIDMDKVNYKVKNPPKYQEVLAFCGLARPEKFAKTLKNLGLIVHELIEFSDHYDYDDSEILSIIKKAQKLNLPIVTTEKDHVKLSENLKEQIYSINIEAILPKESKQEIIRSVESAF